MNNRLRFCFSLALFGCETAHATVKFPAIFSDHMVLQQAAKVPVWGWADPGEKVTVTAGGKTSSATAGADGQWKVLLDPLPVTGEPIELQAAGKNRVTVKDVLVGEVWICSGQSNMEWPLQATFSSADIRTANHPGLRFFKVSHRGAFEPQVDCEGQWVLCSPKTAGGFSGVGFYFGRELHRSLRTPVGMIGSHWGGTPAQSWTSLEAMQAEPGLKKFCDAFEKLKADRAQLEAEYDKHYLPQYEAAFKKWQDEIRTRYDRECKEWAGAMKQAKADGKPAPLKPVLKQPAPPKYDCVARRPQNPTVLNNGMIVPLIPFAIKGVIWYQGESNTDNPILYRTLFPALIRDWRGRWDQGDFPFLFVQLANTTKETDKIHLLREAQLASLSLPNTGMAVTIDIGEPQIHPRNKRDVGLRLALAARHVAYGEDIVSSGPIYRSMQVEGAKIRLTFDAAGGGLVIGAPPPGRPGEAPATPASELKGFTIAGADRVFVPATAKIEQNTVVVWAERIPNPVAVRYGWTDAPDVNLYNREHLPASPFRTDNW